MRIKGIKKIEILTTTRLSASALVHVRLYCPHHRLSVGLCLSVSISKWYFSPVQMETIYCDRYLVL